MSTPAEVREALERMVGAKNVLSNPWVTHGQVYIIGMWQGSPWVFWRHPDGQLVSKAKVKLAALSSTPESEELRQDGCVTIPRSDLTRILDELTRFRDDLVQSLTLGSNDASKIEDAEDREAVAALDETVARGVRAWRAADSSTSIEVPEPATRNLSSTELSADRSGEGPVNSGGSGDPVVETDTGRIFG